MAAAKKLRKKPAVKVAPRAAKKRVAKKGAARDESLTTITWWDAFYAVIRRIPRGRVCTYGVVAALAGKPRASRHVGFALAALKETGKNSDVPWQRVLGVRSRGRAGVSIKDPVGGAIQRALLEKEGVRFDTRGSVALASFGWSGEVVRPKKVTQKTIEPKRNLRQKGAKRRRSP